MTSIVSASVAPFGLEAGLKLESAQIVLPWDAGLETLEQLAKPQRHAPEKSKEVWLSWLGERVFDSLEVETWYQSSRPNTFSFQPPKTTRFDSAQEEFRYFLPRLVERFGAPHTDKKVEGYPWVVWRYGEIRVSLCIGERFTDYVSFMATKGSNRAVENDAPRVSLARASHRGR